MSDPNERELPEHDEPVRAVPFEPSRGVERRRRRLLGPVASASLVLLAVGGIVLWFLLSARSVQFQTVPADARLQIDGGLHFDVAERTLMRPGEYRVRVTAPGHYELERSITVTDEVNQRFPLALQRLPGRLQVASTPPGAELRLGDELLGRADEEPLTVPAGPQILTVAAPRFFTRQVEVDVVGMERLQELQVALEPAFGTVSLATEPEDASVWVDEQELGRTPGHFEIDAGEQRVVLRKDGYETASLLLTVTAGERLEPEPVRLEPADATLRIRSRPSGANVTVGGRFQGRTPIEVAVEPGQAADVQLFLTGYEVFRERLTLRSGEQRDLVAPLSARRGRIELRVTPADARVFVDGELRGTGTQVLDLPAAPHSLRVSRQGYEDRRIEVLPKPGLPQTLSVELLTAEQAFWANIEPSIRTALDQEMLLVRPAPFTMGASRREPGRRANEALRDVVLERAFYMSRHEVTNAEFRKFRPGHSSGNLGGNSLNGPKQPVVNVRWEDAAAFCNWLSERDGLDPVYIEMDGVISGFNPDATGYRLPSEAEWAFVARVGKDGEVYKFPWGNVWPPSQGAGNFADASAADLFAQLVDGYRDNEPVSAPVGSFKENWRGFFDLGGNVSEWIHDHYVSGVGLADGAVDPLGPEVGEFHVVRDASYRHGSIVELRLSYRDYGSEPQPDLGFRLVRYVR